MNAFAFVRPPVDGRNVRFLYIWHCDVNLMCFYIKKRHTIQLKKCTYLSLMNGVFFYLPLVKTDKNMYGLLSKCEVKMAGYWPNSFFACSKTRKKRTRPISSHLDRTNLVNKGFIIWLLGKFFLRDKAGSPERARWLHLARSGSQSQRRI